MKRIYADNAATTQMSQTAIAAMLPYLDKVYGNPSSLHSPGQEAAEALLQARTIIAEQLNCQAKEIYFNSGGSEADNQAIVSAAMMGAAKGKKHLISSKFEHHAVLHTLEKLADQGFEVTLLDVYRDGLVRIEDVKAAIREDTALVSIMFANNEIGTIQPIEAIGKLCREKKVLFHTDAVQAAGHLHLDVQALQVDMLSLSAHKFHGPKGIGALYAKANIRLANIIEGGAQERGKRGGTENIPAIMGMAAAFEEACRNIDQNAAYVGRLRDKLMAALTAIPHSTVNGDRVQRLPGNLNMCFEGIEGESLLLLLDQQGIAASSGSACTSGSLDPSHVLLAIGLPHEVAHGSLRLSLCEMNTEKEIDYIGKTVPEVVAYLRSISPVWHDLQKGIKQYVIQ